jgi:hypothetical protein
MANPVYGGAHAYGKTEQLLRYERGESHAGADFGSKRFVCFGPGNAADLYNRSALPALGFSRPRRKYSAPKHLAGASHASTVRSPLSSWPGR